jgi:6-phosphogluconolactonase
MKLIAVLLAAPFLTAFAVSAQLMYVGTYTGGDTRGIYAYRFDPRTGKLAPLGLMAETPNPTFLALHPSGKYLYAVNEINDFEGKKAGALSAFSVDRATGKLTLLNQISTGGPGPCAVTVDKTGKVVFVANYEGGSFASYSIGSDGKVGAMASLIQDKGSSINKSRQEGPHSHSVVVSPDNKFLLGADLGLDHVLIFHIDASTGKISPNDPPFATVKAGSGPRHLVFAPDGKHVYVVSEMGEIVTTFGWDAARGALTAIDEASALPADFHGRSTSAEIQIDAHGRHVYSSNRGHDSISVFNVDPNTGKLSLAETTSTQGKTPRFFCLDPSGRYLLAGNQDTNTITTYHVDPRSGKLTPTGDKYELGKPVCFVFVK